MITNSFSYDLIVSSFGYSFIVYLLSKGASDIDSPAESIIFHFEGSQCGYLAVGFNLTDPVKAVTQKQIEDGQVAFVHEGILDPFRLHWIFLEIQYIFA